MMKQGQSSSSRLIRRLRSGPIDVIGDIHGEAGPLMRLLDRLGYTTVEVDIRNIGRWFS